MDETESTYLDYETFLDASFSPIKLANTLVLATNNSSDSPLDLTTPLSRVLFDVQEVDTHIDRLTNKSAVSILNFTKTKVEASEKVLRELESQVDALNSSYESLEREVIRKHDVASETGAVAGRLWQTLRLGRSISRCLTLGRQLEIQTQEMKEAPVNKAGQVDRVESAKSMVRSANIILSFRRMLDPSRENAHIMGLERILLVKGLQRELFDPAEKQIVSRAEQIVGQFSISALADQAAESLPSNHLHDTSSFTETEYTKSRTVSALTTLYLLSPIETAKSLNTFDPSLFTASLHEYLRRSITASIAGLTGALTTLPKLERTLTEVSARCQNIVALELLLRTIRPPAHPLFEEDRSSNSLPAQEKNLLLPFLTYLDTSSLPSYFWRSMASQMTTRVQKILKDGGVSARTLRSNRDRIRDALRECVYRGSQLPSGLLGKSKDTLVGNWEREAAVMVGSVVNALGR